MKIVRKTIENDEEYLRQISKEETFEDIKTLKDEIKLLEEYCLQTECFALASIQIGIPKRIIYLKNTSLDIAIENKEYNEAKVLINPVVLLRKGKTKFWEGCLSCLDYLGLVVRPYMMKVRYQDIEGKEHEETFEGFESTVLSHELDHLDGILHMDIAEEIKEVPIPERPEFRKTHKYEIISKTCKYIKKK